MSALIFDCDGVLADTERYGHLPAFNTTFEQYGLPTHWDEDEYAIRLRIGGGKERMASLFDDPDFVARAGIPDDPTLRADLLAAWHRTKSQTFKRMVSQGALPARPGISRLIPEALAAGWSVCVASTSAVESVRAVLVNAVGEQVATSVPIFAGDVVPAKKPDPAIYLLALDRLDLDPHDALVVEDSRNGLRAAVGAGLPCLVTVNGYTRGEDFSEATLVVSDLGDPDGPPIEVIANRGRLTIGKHVTLETLSQCIAARATTSPAEV
ncbi:HAD-IA family hydrolase [Lapillicoccus sp.]|uniref:HAD-IA family hydrolase n=1 Tax=Lapillicoccus sp. TaxID=1909287 RepID=UPI0025EE5AA3|nr:HAD-IA family hydrolase [Lapillicoccus sp.]